MSAEPYEPLLDDKQAGAFLRLHSKTVQRLARRGEIPAFRIGRYYRYRASELDVWLRSQVVHSPCQVSTRVVKETEMIH